MVLWDIYTSLPSSQSTGFQNKISIPCPDTWSLDLLACHAASSRSLDLVTSGWGTTPLGLHCTLLPCFLNYDFFFLAYFFKRVMWVVLLYFVKPWAFLNILQLPQHRSAAYYSESLSRFTLWKRVLASQMRFNWSCPQSHLFLQKLKFLTY